MSEHKKERTYFDDSTLVLAPVYIIVALSIIFGTIFFG